MKNKLIKIAFIIAFFSIAAYIAIVNYALMTIDIEKLIVTSLHPETSRFPSGLPEFYLFHFRGNDKDLELLNKGKGLGFILSDMNSREDKALKYASFFLKKGIDINLIGFDGLTALHSAILQNRPNYVSYLLNNGADIDIGVGYSYVLGSKEKTKMYGMNSKQLATFASERDKKDRGRIIKMLNEYQKK